MSYKQILTTNDIGTGANQIAAGNHNHDSNYVKKSGDTMTGRLAVDKAGRGFRINNGSTGYIELARDNGGAQLYGLWDCIKQKWIVQSDGTNVSFHGNADSASNADTVDGYHASSFAFSGFAPSNNFNQITSSGFYRVNDNITNSPPASAWGQLIVCHGAGDTITQIYGDFQSGTLYTRSGNPADVGGPGSWTQWYQIWKKGDLVTGAVWNDYAEFREGDTIEPGKCVIEVGDDTLITSTERMMPGANITSDTFGFAIGETEQAKTPIAVSGRVLAYPYESREEFKKNIGRPVCSGPNGTVSIMTDEEYRDKGYCAIGTISAVPDYEEWGTGKVKVNGRVWIKVF